MPKNENVVSIADAISDLRKQIKEARKRSDQIERDDYDVQFNLCEIEVELQLAIQDVTGEEAEAGFSFCVLKAGISASQQLSTTNMHTIRLKLKVDDKLNPGKDVNLGGVKSDS